MDNLHPVVDISKDYARHDPVTIAMLALIVAFHCRGVDKQCPVNDKGKVSVGLTSESLAAEYRTTLQAFLTQYELDGPKEITGAIISHKDQDLGQLDLTLLFLEDGKTHGYNYQLKLDPSASATFYREIYRKMAADGRLEAQYLPIDNVDNLAALLEYHTQIEVYADFNLRFPGANTLLN